MRNVWTGKRVTRLQELLSGVDQLSSEVIAGMLNEEFRTTYSRKAIINTAQRLGFGRRGETGTLWPEDRRVALVELCNNPAGMSFAVIARRLNERFGTEYTRSAVIGCASRMGLKDRELPGDREETARKVPHSLKRSRHPDQITSDSRNNSCSAPLHIGEHVEVLPLRCVEIVPRNLRITELEDGDCRYAYGDEAAEIKFCGHPRFKIVIGDAVRESSYCELHHLISKRSGTPTKQRVAA
jgi:GcrA cell cycle regulator